VALPEATGQDKKIQELLHESGVIPRHVAIIMDGNGRWATRHVAIIMDGNGRWATKRGLPRIAGHHEGVNSVRDIVEACGQLGVEYLTLYAFSTENWKRPKEEVSLLMRLLLKALRDERDRLHQNGVQLKAIGDIAALPQDVQDELLDAIKMMQHNTGLTLILALSYSGRWDLVNAVRKLAADVQSGKVAREKIDEPLLEAYLSTKGYPDPDLLVRTSGEQRISNFLLWQIAYSELYITSACWPDFRRKQLYAAVAEFQKRDRRFGMLSTKHGGDAMRRWDYVERFLKSVSKL